MAQTVSMTSKGQVTIPRYVRKDIGANEAGTQIEFVKNDNGQYVEQVVASEPENLFAQLAPGEGYQMIQEFGFADTSVGVEGKIAF